jgi:hypothetical protein
VAERGQRIQPGGDANADERETRDDHGAGTDPPLRDVAMAGYESHKAFTRAKPPT